MAMNRQPSSPGRAFSLVELLFVVATIVILIAILIPSMEVAFGRSRQAKCLSNIRQQGAAILAYASDSGGAIPPVSSDAPSNNLSKSYNPRWFITEPMAGTQVTWNLGALWQNSKGEGYLRDDGKVYFCPAQTHEDFIWDTYATGAMGASFPVAKDTLTEPMAERKSGVRLPYYYNPVMDNPASAAPPPLFTRVSELGGKSGPDPQDPSKTIIWPSLLVIDTVELNPDAPAGDPKRFSTIAHADSPGTTRPMGGWNLLRGDGSTTTVADDPKAATTILQDIGAAVSRRDYQKIYLRISQAAR